jgi:Putative transposase DNA-binding domain
MVLTYRYRIKDATSGRQLERQSREVNRVWTLGSKLLGLHSDTVQAVCKQFAGRKPRVRAIHAKIVNCRKHFLHGLSTRLVRENRRICVGNVNSSGLARTTQVCSACGARGGPQGREDLVVREWICGSCGAWHDRDINSAINILVSGRNVGLPGTEIPSLQGGADVKVSSARFSSSTLTRGSPSTPSHRPLA